MSSAAPAAAAAAGVWSIPVVCSYSSNHSKSARSPPTRPWHVCAATSPASLAIGRDTASRLGISTAAIDDTLYDAFGLRQGSTMYRQLNQYHVGLEVGSNFWQNPDGLKHIYVRSTNRTLVPLSAFTHYAP